MVSGAGGLYPSELCGRMVLSEIHRMLIARSVLRNGFEP